MKMLEFDFPSEEKGLNISALKFLPEGEVKGIVVLIHGMAEKKERYEDFAKFLCDNGYAVYINDHIGHGKSLNSEITPGYFGENNEGGNVFVKDVHKLAEIAKNENPGKKLVVFGHSMGSFVARLFTLKYQDEMAGAIYCGTSGPQPVDVAIKLSEIIMKIKGEKYISSLVSTLAFAGYNSKTEKRTSCDWLSRDKDIVDAYMADPLCGFTFTVSGFHDMFTMLKIVMSQSFYTSLNKSLPILVISGTMDPVGNFSKGVKKFEKSLREAGLDPKVIFYENARHEILNELQKEQTYQDVLDFINSCM
ncbi:MAG: alpha/beta hydrolase [Clostridia bacterium]|nr:alpha/beta hydrolase [Clostridia bacterium]